MSNLLEKASIITTPTAYSDGKLHSVKPVQYLGSELVTNGDFATDSNWNVGTGGLITNGELVFSSQNTSGTFQSISHQVGKTYKVSVEIKSVSNGSLRLDLAGGGAYTQHFSTVGIHTSYITPVQGGSFFIRTNAFVGSIDNVSVKEVIDADFDFQRGSAATRVNSQGLIENVQTLSGNLVQNGDFSEIGSEEVTNGDFEDGGTGWSNSSINGFSVSNGKLNLLDVAYVESTLQTNVTTVGKLYKVTYEVSNYVQGSFRIGLGGTLLPTTTSNGVYTYYVTATNSTYVFIQAFSGLPTTLSIDNVSVKEVGQNWSFINGTNIGDNKAIISGDGSLAGRIEQLNVFASGKTYKITLDSIINSGGGLNVKYGVAYASNIGSILTTGSYTFYYTASSNQPLIISRKTGGVAYDSSVTNISVIEITDDTDLPRIDYTDGCGSLLLEPQRTNSIANSNFQSGWSILSGGSFIYNQSISPDGTLNAVTLTGDGSNSNAPYTGVSVVSGTSYVFSVFVKPILATSFQMIGFSVEAGGTVKFDLSNGTVSVESNDDLSGAKIEDYGSGWYRCSVIATADGTGPALFGFNSELNINGNNFYIYGAQVEVGSYPTSYIPTNGSTATRLADVCNNSGSSDLINSTEGVLYAEIAALREINDNVQFLSLGSGSYTSNSVFLQLRGTANQLAVWSYSNNVNQLAELITVTDIKQFNKIAVSYKLNDFKVYVNGSIVYTSTTYNPPASNSLNVLQFLRDDFGAFFGKTKCVAVFKEALTNDELEGLTGEGYDTFNALALANNYTII
jgi:hypothetical protein